MARNGLERRFAPWVDTVGDLLDNLGDVTVAQLCAELHATFGTQASWHWVNGDGSFGFQLHRPIPGWPDREHMDFWGSEAFEVHPLVRWFRASGDATAMSLGRVPATVSDPRGCGVVREQLAPVSIEQQLSIPYRLNAHGHRAFVLASTGTDFSDEDLALARQIQPLLILLARQTAVRERCGSVRGDAAAAAFDLTGREVAVLTLLADGHTAAVIGRRLGISARTVHVHLAHLYRKLDVHDRLTAVRVARDCGLLSPDHRPEPVVTLSTRRDPADRPIEDRTSAAHRAFAWRPDQGAVEVPER
jgi:DNA-binding CsgD family transcriptional regulator